MGFPYPLSLISFYCTKLLPTTSVKVLFCTLSAMAKTLITTLLLALFSSLSYAIDMSIIDHKNKEGILYEKWLAEHGKIYNALGEKEKRFEIFKDNLRFIEEHNNSKNQTYVLGLNRFADLTNEEYRTIFLGTKSDARRRLVESKNASHHYDFRASDSVPKSVDWRKKGAVAPIKDQGTCGNYTYYFLSQYSYTCYKGRI